MSGSVGLILVSLYATGSGRSFLNKCQPTNVNCHDYRTVASLIKQCAPSVLYDMSSIDLSEPMMPFRLWVLNSLTCSFSHAMDACLTITLASCENREFIKEYVNQTRPLCIGAHLVGWFEEALASLPPISNDCLLEVDAAGDDLCKGGQDSFFFKGELKVRRNRPELVFFGEYEVSDGSPACEDLHRAIFANLMLVNGFGASNVMHQSNK